VNFKVAITEMYPRTPRELEGSTEDTVGTAVLSTFGAAVGNGR